MNAEESGSPQNSAADKNADETADTGSDLNKPSDAVADNNNPRNAAQNASKKDTRFQRILARIGMPRLVWQFIIPAITGILTLGLIFVQTRIYNTQTQIFGEQLVEMRKSTDAATQSAKAAQDAVDQARQSREGLGNTADSKARR